MKKSNFGTKFTENAGILRLMADIGESLESKDLILMGGGNPAPVAKMIDLYTENLKEIANDRNLVSEILGCYDPPEGDLVFRKELAAMFNRQYQWGIDEKNICLTNGSQSAFFMLFNLFAGESEKDKKHILFPLVPEYLGYADSGLSPDFFQSVRPRIEYLPDHFYKYHIDFDALSIKPDTAAVCVSRPTNPTGNLLTDEEIRKLDELCQKAGVPLIIDNAYGLPFPCMVYKEVEPFFSSNTILLLSLSKIGLPGARTGIVIASEKIIKSLGSINTIMSLATGSIGGRVLLPFVKDDTLLPKSREIITPYYKERRDISISILKNELEGLDYYIHLPEGAMFLWVWIKGMPVSSEELYQLLKKNGVVIVPGHYFFPGLAEAWDHSQECIRVTYALDDIEKLKNGLKKIGQVVRELFSSKLI